MTPQPTNRTPFVTRQRAAIFHGYGATPEDHWFQWLAHQLKAAGIPTLVPALPNPLEPDPQQWEDTVVWRALTDAALTAKYWGHSNVSDWQPGSPWEHRRIDGSGTVDVAGEVIKAEPPTRLVITFEDSDEEHPNGPSIVTFLIEPHEGIVRLTVTHENLPNPEMLHGISNGWPAILANLKSLLETGETLPAAPWTMPHAASS